MFMALAMALLALERQNHVSQSVLNPSKLRLLLVRRGQQAMLDPALEVTSGARR